MLSYPMFSILLLLLASPYSRSGKVGKQIPFGGCPICDASVYGYCSDKLLHDACCCLDPYETDLPHECGYADCSFLHANSCREHHLITRCCCTNGF